jgi:hypothetical protein
MDGELRDQRLPRPGGRGDDGGVSVADGGDRPELEIVEGEGVASDEGSQQILGHAHLLPNVTLT